MIVNADKISEIHAPKENQTMSFTIVFAALALLILGAVFAITDKLRGAKAAWIAAGITVVVEAVAFIGIIAAIVSVMPN